MSLGKGKLMFCYCDFHIHSCLSPCGEPEMTPSNIARMAALQGYDMIAVSDHNTAGNCRAVIRAADGAGIMAIPAMELTTSEEAHILCLLPSLEAAEELSEYVHKRLSDIRNQPEFFGEQILLDHNDKFLGYEERLLLGATSISVQEVPYLIQSFGGVAIPAHIDRSSFSILSNLGFLDPALGFQTVEITKDCNPQTLLKDYPELRGLSYYVNSDAHNLYALGQACFGIELRTNTAKAVIEVFKKGDTKYRF